MREDFVQVQAGTDLKVESNLGENPNELWHFNMYGPDEQSFHQVWSPAVANAVTVRTTGKADEQLKGRLIEQVELKAQSSVTDKLTYEELIKGLLEPIADAETRIAASAAYQIALQLLAERTRKL
jgi:hypothetical protein